VVEGATKSDPAVAAAATPAVPVPLYKLVVDGISAAFIACANAVVASLVEESEASWVVAVVPLGNAGVPDRFEAVPVVF
jgi:hypothetical protein